MTWHMSYPVPFKKGNSLLLTKPHCIFSNSFPPTTGTLLEQIHLYSQVEATGDVVSDQRAIDAVVTHQDTKDQEK